MLDGKRRTCFDTHTHTHTFVINLVVKNMKKYRYELTPGIPSKRARKKVDLKADAKQWKKDARAARHRANILQKCVMGKSPVRKPSRPSQPKAIDTMDC